MEKVVMYESPMVEIIEVEVEKGFAASGSVSQPGMEGFGTEVQL